LSVFNETEQIAICNDARNIDNYIEKETIKLIITSPPYANLLNRKRKNKSRRGELRKNDQYNRVEQYSQDSRDIGILELDDYSNQISYIYEKLYPLLQPKGHCVINVADMWWENERIPIHISIIRALENAGFKFRNTIIWDRTNIVNSIGVFGWPSNYITLGTTFSTNPWENVYWFSRMFINSDKYGGIGADSKAMMTIANTIKSVAEMEEEEEEIKFEILTKTLKNVMLRNRKQGTGKYRAIELLYEDLCDKLIYLKDLEVLALTCEKIMVPINEAIKEIPGDDKITEIGSHRAILYLPDSSLKFKYARKHPGMKNYVRPMTHFIDD